VFYELRLAVADLIDVDRQLAQLEHGDTLQYQSNISLHNSDPRPKLNFVCFRIGNV
jgi:hypothetical protein